MNTKGLLDQLMSSGQAMLREQGLGGGNQGDNKRGAAESTKESSTGSIGNMLSGFGGGTLAGGALGMLLGNKRFRKFGGKTVAYGGVAALGALAYRAYSDWQSQQDGTEQKREPRTIDRVSDNEAEEQSRAILKALVGASRADGHIDDNERELIEQEIEKADGDRDLRDWLDQELRKPLDPAEVASAASSPEVAAEMYLVSRLAIDEQNYMERAYLDELARCMKLDPALRERLDREAERAEAA